MGRPKSSLIYQHFDKAGDKSVCKACKVEITVSFVYLTQLLINQVITFSRVRRMIST